MNAQNAHEYLPLVQALADGKTLQLEGYAGWVEGYAGWVDLNDEIYFGATPQDYRIKPEPRTFEIVRSKLTGDIYSAETYDGSSPNWERITVVEVIK